MSIVRILSLAVVIGLATMHAASAQQHWLIGSWSGTLTNLPTTNRFGADRTLEVKSVSADGTKGQGSWISGAGTYQISLDISGDDVAFTTPGTGGANYKLKHAAGTLTGEWAPVGGGRRGGNVTLKKK